jgi:hypothetical protein
MCTVDKPRERRPAGKPGRGVKDNIKVNLNETGKEGV